MRRETLGRIWSNPQLVAYFSQARLEPGDVISTGTPAGVAAGRGPSEAQRFLKPSDVIEAEVELVGCLRSRIVNDSPKRSSWD